MKKALLILTTAVAFLTSCKEETCDISFCDMTFHFTAESSDPDTFPVEKLQLFMKDNVSDDITGPVVFDPAALKASAVREGSTVRFSATQRIPRGNYTLWCWANVHDESVYSFDRYSLSSKNNITGSYYLLGKAAEMQIGQRLMECSFELYPVTAQVPLTIHPTYDRVVSLYVAEVALQVDADGNCSGEKTLAIEADRFEPMPPSTIYLIPTAEGSTQPAEFTLTYQVGSTNYVERAEATLQAGQNIPVTFGEP